MEDEYTSLHLAAKYGDANQIGQLLADGGDGNVQTQRQKYTPLHVAAFYGNHGAVARLLATGTNVYINVRDAKRRTPLHYAVLEDHESIVEQLVKNNADPTIMDLNGYTPRTLALRYLRNGAISVFNHHFELKAPIYGPKGKVFPPPKPGGEVAQICKKFRGFILSREDDNSLTVSRPTVWDMLYNLDLHKTKGLTWIHVPANNRVWVTDLIQSIHATHGRHFDQWQKCQRFIDDTFQETGRKVLYRLPRCSSQSSCTDVCSMVVPVIDVDVISKAIATRKRPVTFACARQEAIDGAIGERKENLDRVHRLYPNCVHLPRTMSHFHWDACPNGAEHAKGDSDGVISKHLPQTLEDSNSMNERTGVREDDSTPPIRALVVPQLWLWRITSNIIVSAFPEKCDVENPDNVVESVYSAMANETHNYCTWGPNNDLLGHIAMACVDHTNKQFYIGNAKPFTIRAAFDHAISDVKSAARLSYQKFTDHDGKASRTISKDIRDETKHLEDIDEILRELVIVKRVMIDQEQVMSKFREHEQEWSQNLSQFDKDMSNDQLTRHGPREFAHPLIKIFDRLEEDAVQVRRSIATLLDLMQKEATIDEANSARSQAFALFVFTGVIFIFAPLTFAVTLIGLRITGFSDEKEPSWVAEVLGLTLLATVFLTALPTIWYFVRWKHAFKKTSAKLKPFFRKPDGPAPGSAGADSSHGSVASAEGPRRDLDGYDASKGGLITYGIVPREETPKWRGRHKGELENCCPDWMRMC